MQAQDATASKDKRYKQYVLFGIEEKPYENGTLVLTADLTARSFFQGLLRKQVDNQTVTFWRGNDRVYNYPDNLSVELLGWVRPERSFATLPPYPQGVNDYFEKLQFKVQWKRGLKFRPVRGIEIHKTKPQEVGWDAKWKYSIQIGREDVPLTDHLVVTVSDREGRLFARFSAQL